MNFISCLILVSQYPSSKTLFYSRPGLKACDGCLHMFYCSKECQKNDWKIHKLECKIYKAHYERIQLPHPTNDNLLTHDYFWFLLRVYLTLERFPDRRTESFKVPGTDPVKYRSYDDLRTCVHEIRTDLARVLNFEMIWDNFYREAGLNFNRGKLFEHFCKIAINRFCVKNVDLRVIGLSIFVPESGFKHSCIPNAALVFNGMNLEVRALKNIPKDEKITINYVTTYISNGIISQEDRLKLLKKQYFFDCSCPICLNCKGEGKFFLKLIIDN